MNGTLDSSPAINVCNAKEPADAPNESDAVAFFLSHETGDMKYTIPLACIMIMYQTWWCPFWVLLAVKVAKAA